MVSDTFFCAIVIPFGFYSIKDKAIKQHEFNPLHDVNQHAFEMLVFNDSLCNYRVGLFSKFIVTTTKNSMISRTHFSYFPPSFGFHAP